MLSSHPAVTRLGAAALFFAVVIAFSQQSPAQAGPEIEPPASYSLLPQAIGTRVPANGMVIIEFAQPMDMASVADALSVSPDVEPTLTWDPSGDRLFVAPPDRWATDSTYTISVDETARTADGEQLARVQRYAFSTQTAPTVTEFRVELAELEPVSEHADGVTALTAADAEATPPAAATLSTSQTARIVSAQSTVRISFSAAMDRTDVERSFSIAPDVAGELAWIGNDLIFTPTERLQPGGRYTVSLIGANDRLGNPLGGKPNFSFLVQTGAQVTKTSPEADATQVDGAKVEIWFSQPMNIDAAGRAFRLVNATTDEPVGGTVTWNRTGTMLIFRPDAALRAITSYEASLGTGALDADGNAVTAAWSFTTKAAPAPPPTPAPEVANRSGAEPQSTPTPKPTVPAAAPSSSLAGYALNQINAARAAYGKPPLALDAGLSATASAHALDQLNRGYYAHSPRPGGFGAWGENQCHRYGWGAQKTMDWCHSVFMSEPWPGYPNHIGNILSDRYTRVGVGVADNGSRVVITWQFAN